MALLDVSEVLLSTEFMQPVIVIRKSNGRWESGKFVQDEYNLSLDMLVTPVNEKEIQMIPEADKIQDAKSFHCLTEIFLTEDSTDENGDARTSDIVVWHGDKYKLTSMSDYSDYGYYKAFGVRIKGY